MKNRWTVLWTGLGILTFSLTIVNGLEGFAYGGLTTAFILIGIAILGKEKENGRGFHESD